METSSYTSSSSSSNSSLSPPEAKRCKPPLSSTLHAVRKSIIPRKVMKKPIAPLPPTPPKVYKVEPRNFREAVQKLTAAPEYQPHKCRQKVEPLQLNLLPMIPNIDIVAKQPPHPQITAATYDDEAHSTHARSSDKEMDTFEALSPLGFPFSPPRTCLSSQLLTPETLSSLEASTIL